MSKLLKAIAIVGALAAIPVITFVGTAHILNHDEPAKTAVTEQINDHLAEFNLGSFSGQRKWSGIVTQEQVNFKTALKANQQLVVTGDRLYSVELITPTGEVINSDADFDDNDNVKFTFQVPANGTYVIATYYRFGDGAYADSAIAINVNLEFSVN